MEDSKRESAGSSGSSVKGQCVLKHTPLSGVATIPCIREQGTLLFTLHSHWCVDLISIPFLFTAVCSEKKISLRNTSTFH